MYPNSRVNSAWYRKAANQGYGPSLHALGLAHKNGYALPIASVGAVIVLYWKRRKDPELSLLRWAYGGILLSAPFLPPVHPPPLTLHP